MANLKKRTLALIMTLVLALGLLPTAVLATANPLTPEDTYAENKSITLHKQAERTAADEWKVDLYADVQGIEIMQQPLEVVYVLDVSGSMAWCTTSAEHAHKINTDCYTETTEAAFDAWYAASGATGKSPLKDDDFHKGSGADEGLKIATLWVHYEDDTDDDYWTDSTWRVVRTKVGEGKDKYYTYTYYQLTDTTEEHIHSGGGIACSDVTNKKSSSRLAVAVSAIGSMDGKLETKLDEGYGASYVIFSSSSKEEQNGVGKKDAAAVITKDQLETVTAYGGTNLNAGVNTALGKFSENAASRQVLVIVTDGEANEGKENGSYYPTAAVKGFKDDGGIVYTVGFMYGSDDLSNLATDSDHALAASDDTALNEAMDSISTDVSAMILDPLGDTVDLKGAVSVGDDCLTDGVINTSSSGVIKWLPGATKIQNNKIGVTYTVKLNNQADLTAGVHSNVPLNKDATLEYSVVVNGVQGDAQSADFPLPKATYAVGTLEVEYQDGNGKTINVGSLPEHKATFDKQTLITDYSDVSFTNVSGYGYTKIQKDTTDYYVRSTDQGGVDVYRDGELLSHDLSDIPAVADAHAYKVVYRYNLVKCYTVTYAYTNAAPANASVTDPSTLNAVEPENSTVSVAAEPTSPTHNFSGWILNSGSAEGWDTDGEFTLTGNVEFQGTWTVKNSYNVTADYYTTTDGQNKTKDNEHPVSLTGGVVYTNEESVDYTVPASANTWNGKTGYTTPDDTSFTVIPVTPTATYHLTYTRNIKTQADYTVTHKFYDVAPNGTAVEKAALQVVQNKTGDVGDTVLAKDLTSSAPNGETTKTYERIDADPASITLVKNGKQNITISYYHYTYSVAVTGDAGVSATTPATATTYDKGANVPVSWTLVDGYQVKSVTDTASSGKVSAIGTINGLAENHTIQVVTERIPYELTVKYVFSDGSHHGGFETTTTTKYVGDPFTVSAKAAPGGYYCSMVETTHGTVNDATKTASGTFGAGSVTVTITYTLNGEAMVAVAYQDESGNALTVPDTVKHSATGVIGRDTYNLNDAMLSTITVGDKIYDFVIDNSGSVGGYTGTFATSYTITRTYRERAKYAVSIELVSERPAKATLMPAAPVTATIDGGTYYVGKGYDVTGKIPATVLDTEGRTWKRTELPANVSGKQETATGVTVTAQYYLDPTVTYYVTYETYVNGKLDDSKTTHNDPYPSVFPGEAGEDLLDQRPSYAKGGFELTSDGYAKKYAACSPMGKFENYDVYLVYRQDITNAASILVTHVRRTYMDGQLRDTRESKETVTVEYQSLVNGSSYSKVGQAGYTEYRLISVTPAEAFVAAGGEEITLIYRRDLYSEPGKDDEDIPEYPVKPSDPTPPTEEIPDEETPLAPAPTEPVTEQPSPDETTEIPDEETPLANAPKTGDSLGLWVLAAGASGIGLVWLALSNVKRNKHNAD